MEEKEKQKFLSVSSTKIFELTERIYNRVKG